MKQKRDIVSKREDYKRFIVFCLASLIILAQAAVFAYVWYDFYRIRMTSHSGEEVTGY